MKFVFRDDNISRDTDINVLKHIHKQFLIHHQTHTISLICNGLETNKEVIRYIHNSKNWDFAIQGWDMVNYSLMSKQQIEDDVDKCILKVEAIFGVTPEKWYLPWNGWTKENGFDLVPRVADISLYHGVDVDIDCDHISHFTDHLENGGQATTSTIYFNNWQIEDIKLLPNLLYLTRRYNENKKTNFLQDNI